VPNKEFWGVGEDVTWTARFMRQYLNRAQRWSSPKYVAGESYGGFRAARLADTAQTQFGVALNGVIMISPIIEYSTARYSRYAFLPAVLQLPTFAAVAWYHGKIDGATADPAARDRLLAEVEAYSVSDALTALAQGDGLPPAQRDALYDKLARYTGLSIDAVRRFNGRIRRDLYVKELLAKSGRVLGIYDASVTMEDPDPASPFFRDADPTSQRLTAPLLTALNAYLRDELKVTTNSSYILSNSQANNSWEWGRGRTDGSADALRAGMIANPALRVLVVHGRYDLITPYFASKFVLSQLAIPASLRKNLSIALTEGGHMMYLHASERARLYEIARDFYAAAGGAKE
jgi:carboxypeptidase C (cathepsin A)